ncbi:MAG TPA: RluA family pseudouridine synthase [Thermoanaerobaculia bacterium]|jgi:23S rRNA pseudouridine1911/1915/1917 synthase|nr:RluA family pseudouridine synthase [Thermoanaerobaculia bacterium]
MRRTITEPVLLLDALQHAFPDSSKTTLRQMLQSGRVRVDGDVEKDARRLLEADDLLEVMSKSPQRELPPGLAILHEDADVIVVLKSNGLLTVATEREREATAQAYLNTYVGAKLREERIHVVHRLDRETSGVLVFARNFHARERLKEQFAEHTVDRTYVAIVEGELDPPRGTIRSNLLERRDLRMVSVEAHPDSKHAVTHYRTIESKRGYSMLEVTLETGRKNQIRAHLSEQGHPVVGDQFYGSEINPIGRLGLHAKLLGFDHPVTRKRMTFTAPLPRPFRELFAR